MKLKSPTDKQIRVALLSGATMRIGPEGHGVPPEFVQEALNNGCIAIDVTPGEMGLAKHIPKFEDEKTRTACEIQNLKTAVATKEQEVQAAQVVREKDITPSERTTLLITIAALCNCLGIKYQDRAAPTRIAKMTEKNGVGVSDDTVRRVPDRIPNALETRSK